MTLEIQRAAAAQAPETFNASEVVSLSQTPLWVLGGACVVLLVAAGLSLYGTRGAKPKVRAALAVLRVLMLAAVALAIFEPGLRQLEKSRQANRVAIVVDTSASMAREDGGTTSRVRRALDAAQALTDDLRDRSAPFVAEVHLFDESARPASAEETANLRAGALLPTGHSTSLLSAIQAVKVGESEAPLGGVVILSDGADTSGLSAGLSAGLRTAIEGIGAPVHTVTTGVASDFVDVAVAHIAADDFAFVRNQVEFVVTLRHRGLGALNLERLSLTLREDGRPVLVESVQLNTEGDTTKATLKFEPRSAGKHIYTVEIPVHPAEAIAENNRLDFPLEVIRDRIRVLQVVGRPSWDERFVRRLLKENPSVDLISFFILRTQSDIAGAPPNDLSLIPFPTRELFTEELHTFDVVIFQDFNYRPYKMGYYLSNVRDFVEKAGGGFMMIGGELSFSEGEYDGTPIAEVLPVTLRPGRGHLNEEKFRPVVTEAGVTHPITDLGGIAGRGKSAFSALPPLEGVNLVADLAPGADALLSHPFLNTRTGAPQPVVAVREVGRGRSMAVLTDSTWLWGLPHVGAGGRGDAHRRFYANALRWLIRDPELSRVKVAARGDNFEPGQPIRLEVRSYDSKYAPQGGAQVRAEIVPLDGAGTALSVVRETKTGPDGSVRLEIPASEIEAAKAVAWRVKVEAKVDGKSIGTDEDAFIVRAAKAEKLFAEPRPDVMAAIAALGGGQSVAPQDVAGLPFTDHKVERVHRQRTLPLWNTWWLLVVIVGLAAAEWYVRRRQGFA